MVASDNKCKFVFLALERVAFNNLKRAMEQIGSSAVNTTDLVHMRNDVAKQTIWISGRSTVSLVYTGYRVQVVRSCVKQFCKTFGKNSYPLRTELDG
jgi:enamine deaminase RidA (YjgF/YER057c/UK114 family)